MTQPEPPASVEALFGDPALVRIYRGALAVRRLQGATPDVDRTLEAIRAHLETAVFSPERLPLSERFALAHVLYEAAPILRDGTLLVLAAEIADDALAITATHAAEAATLLADVPEPDRTLRYLRLLVNRLGASPPPSAAPADPAVVAQLYAAVRDLLAPWRAFSTRRAG